MESVTIDMAKTLVATNALTRAVIEFSMAGLGHRATRPP